MKITLKNGMCQTYVNGRFIQHKSLLKLTESYCNELGIKGFITQASV